MIATIRTTSTVEVAPDWATLTREGWGETPHEVERNWHEVYSERLIEVAPRPVKEYIRGAANYGAARAAVMGLPGLVTTADMGRCIERKAPCGCYIIDHEDYPSLVVMCGEHRQ